MRTFCWLPFPAKVRALSGEFSSQIDCNWSSPLKEIWRLSSEEDKPKIRQCICIALCMTAIAAAMPFCLIWGAPAVYDESCMQWIKKIAGQPQKTGLAADAFWCHRGTSAPKGLNEDGKFSWEGNEAELGWMWWSSSTSGGTPTQPRFLLQANGVKKTLAKSWAWDLHACESYIKSQVLQNAHSTVLRTVLI